MDRGLAMKVERLIVNWNDEFPNSNLSAADIKKPHTLMEALFRLFDRLGINKDAVTDPPPKEERNESVAYYWDLLPIINMTRIINHLVSVIPQMSTSTLMISFLQPTTINSYSILMLLFNFMVFNEERLQKIAPEEAPLFEADNEIKALEDKKVKVQGMLNEAAQEKGERVERIEKMTRETKQLEEELKQELAAFEEENKVCEALEKELLQNKEIFEQKELKKHALVEEVNKKRALRVNDAEEAKVKAKLEAQKVQEAEEQLNSLHALLMKKENILKVLQQELQPNFEVGNNLLTEIMKLTQSLKDIEMGDIDSDSNEGQLAVLTTELNEQLAQLNELQAAKEEVVSKRQEALAKRQHDNTVNELQNLEEKNKVDSERYKINLMRTEEIKETTNKYQDEKTVALEILNAMKKKLSEELKSTEEMLLSKITEAGKNIEDKLRQRKG